MAEIDEKPNGDGNTAVDRLIERFGGIRPMAAKLDIPVTTVQGWKKRSAIPASRHSDIVDAAEKHNISMEGIDLAAAEQPIADGAVEVPYVNPFAGAGVLFAVSGGIFVTVALILVFIGLYIVKQKTGDLSHRINMIEQTMGAPSTFEARLAALEHQPHAGVAGEAAPAAVIDLQQRITDLGAQVGKVSSLSQKVEDLQSASGNRDALGQTVSGLQQTIATLQGSVQGLSQSMETMRTHMADIDTALNQKRSENARQFAILLAIDQLREAASTSEPFDTEVAAARALAHDDADVGRQLDVLANYSSGAPTLNDLRVEFSDQASEIVRSNVVGSGKSWMRQALYRLGSVVSVRKIGPAKAASSNSAESLVARAESRLEEGDLNGAVSALQGLDGLPKDVASSWIDSAQQRLAVDGALAELSELSLKRLSAFQATPGSVTGQAPTGQAAKP